MSYTVNGNLVNNRTDWRHRLVPGPLQARSEHHMPGIPQRFVTRGDVFPPDLVVIGFLESNDADRQVALQGLMEIEDLWNEYKATGPHAVSIHGKSFSNMELVDFSHADPEVHGGDAGDGVYRLRRRWAWLWRQLFR